MFPSKRALAGWSIEQVGNLAKSWLEKVRRDKNYELDHTSLEVAYFTLIAPRQLQWDFIYVSTALAETDDELAALGAGPIQQALIERGLDAIPLIIELSRSDPVFDKALQGVNGSESLDEEILSLLEHLRENSDQDLCGSIVKTAHTKRIQSEKAVLDSLREIKRKRAESKALKHE
ncbi:MAG: DUF6869 domain-containing protein [Pseudomonadota bacterium]